MINLIVFLFFCSHLLYAGYSHLQLTLLQFFLFLILHLVGCILVSQCDAEPGEGIDDEQAGEGEDEEEEWGEIARYAEWIALECTQLWSNWAMMRMMVGTAAIKVAMPTIIMPRKQVMRKPPKWRRMRTSDLPGLRFSP